MSKNTLKVDEIKVNRKEFHKFKEPFKLDLSHQSKIVVSEKSKINEADFEHNIGYKED